MMLHSLKGAYSDDSCEVLWEDGERVFCRGWRAGRRRKPQRSAGRALAAERPSPAALDRLAHEYELKDELDAAWAARPLALVREGGRTMLLLEDPGGEPLERLLGAADGDRTLPAPRHRHRRRAAARRTSAASSTRTSSRPTSWSNCRRRTGAADRVWHRLASAARASGARAARVHRRHARLYGARTDRTDEPLDRFAQRPLLRSASRSTRCSPARCRSPRPIRWNGSTATSRESRRRPRAVGECPGAHLRRSS